MSSSNQKMPFIYKKINKNTGHSVNGGSAERLTPFDQYVEGSCSTQDLEDKATFTLGQEQHRR